MILLADNWMQVVLALLVGIFAVIYIFLKWNYSYWDRIGVKTLPGYGFVSGHLKSNLKPNFLPKRPLAAIVTDLYNATDEPYIGIYTLFRPVLLARDPEFIRSIFVQDFGHFTDRRIHFNDDYDPIQGHLFALPGHRWKPLRNKLSPTFTSGKLKAMFSTLVDCGASLQNHLEKVADKGVLLDLQETAASYTTNVIASVAFGFDVDSFIDPNNDFRKYGRSIFRTTFRKAFRRFLLGAAPSLNRALRIRTLHADEEEFITSVVKQTLEYREKNNVVRKDFFQLLIQLRNTGIVHLDDEWETEITGDENQKKMTLDEIKAQTFLFYIAGFETSSTTLSFCLYELAKNLDLQQRAHDEIDRILEKHDGKITYDSVSEMKFLELCIDETLRKYPVLGILNRACVKDYQIPGTTTVIEKGTEIIIPVHALQWDERYYEQPEKFNPDRFSDGNPAGKNQVNQPYYPFGDGPRNCIGIRMGKMQAKVGLVLMLQKFRFDLDDKQKNSSLEYNPKAFLLTPIGGFHLLVSKRK